MIDARTVLPAFSSAAAQLRAAGDVICSLADLSRGPELADALAAARQIAAQVKASAVTLETIAHAIKTDGQ
jgi:hypothetical protein